MYGKKHECAMCHTSETSLWKKTESNCVLCNDCATNKTTCLPPPHRKSRSSSPDVTENDSAIPPPVKNQRLGNSIDNSINDKDERDQINKTKEENLKTNMEVNPGENITGIKAKCSLKEKNKKEDIEDRDDSKRDTRRKTRRGKQGGKGTVPKGKGRRYIFKKSTTKSPAAVSVPVTSESVMFKGQYYQVGDIVSVEDVSSGRYYCQIRGLLQDQYCEKSAVITWLLPTRHSPPTSHSFDPSTYIIGPEEELPRKMEYLQFVCHAPSDYYKQWGAPYPTAASNGTCVWARMGPITH